MSQPTTAAMTKRSNVGSTVFTGEYYVVRTPDWFSDSYSDSGVNLSIQIGDGRNRWGFLDVNDAKMAAAMIKPTDDGRYAIVVKRVESDILV